MSVEQVWHMYASDAAPDGVLTLKRTRSFQIASLICRLCSAAAIFLQS